MPSGRNRGLFIWIQCALRGKWRDIGVHDQDALRRGYSIVVFPGEHNRAELLVASVDKTLLDIRRRENRAVWSRIITIPVTKHRTGHEAAMAHFRDRLGRIADEAIDVDSDHLIGGILARYLVIGWASGRSSFSGSTT